MVTVRSVRTAPLVTATVRAAMVTGRSARDRPDVVMVTVRSVRTVRLVMATVRSVTVTALRRDGDRPFRSDRPARDGDRPRRDGDRPFRGGTDRPTAAVVSVDGDPALRRR